MKYAYFPGCTSQSLARELDHATRLVAQNLGFELIPIDWACCGLGTYEEVDPSMALAMHARIFALAEREGADILTICGTCQLTLARSNKILSCDPQALAKANAVLEPMGIRYNGTIQVKHLLWALLEDYGIDRLKKQVSRQLANLKIGAFYGCHLLRPEANLGYEDFRRPESLEIVIEAVGAEPLYNYRGRLLCCGFHILAVKEATAVNMVGLRLSEAREVEADLLVTPCPLCHVALDTFQNKSAAGQKSIPILHLAQLIGLALGISPSRLKMGTRINTLLRHPSRING